MDSLCSFRDDSSEKFPHLQEIRWKSLYFTQWTYSYSFKKSIFDLFHSYTHLVHSFVAETHCKLYPLIIFRSDDLRRRKRSLKNVVSIENEYSEILVSVGKCLFELYLSSMLLNKPPDDTVIRAQSTSTIIL